MDEGDQTRDSGGDDNVLPCQCNKCSDCASFGPALCCQSRKQRPCAEKLKLYYGAAKISQSFRQGRKFPEQCKYLLFNF